MRMHMPDRLSETNQQSTGFGNVTKCILLVDKLRRVNTAYPRAAANVSVQLHLKLRRIEDSTSNTYLFRARSEVFRVDEASSFSRRLCA